MIYVLIALIAVAIGTFIYSIYGLLTDELVEWSQLSWAPTYPYGFQPIEPPPVDPNIVTHHLLENNNEEPFN